MKAIVVPGVTDLNKGDQALVWESVRLINDTKLFSEVSILSNGDTPEEEYLLCSQSKENGFNILKHLLKHPRRGIHSKDEEIKDSYISLIKQISHALKDLFSRRFLLLVCKNPMLVKMFFSSQVFSTISEFKKSDAIFVKGGGFIHAYGEFKAPYVIWYSLFYIKLALRLRKKVIIFPNSFGPFNGLFVKKQIRSVLSKVDLIFARETISSEALSKLLNKKITIEKDLGFFLLKDDSFNVYKLLEKYQINTSDTLIGITVRPWRFPDRDNPKQLYDNYIESICSFVDFLVEKKHKVVFCNQSMGPNTHEDDRNAIKLIYSKYHDNEHVVWINENLTSRQLKTLYSKFTCFLGTRFHSVIFSTTSLVPSIAIGYGGNKAAGIMEDLNLDKLQIPISEISFDKLKDSFIYLQVNEEYINKLLRENIDSLIDSRDRMIELIRKTMLSVKK